MGHKAGKIALGLGLISGALAGLFFAPDEGKNIRQKIAKGDTKALLKDLEKMGMEMKDMAVDFVQSPGVQDMLETAKDKTADVANMKREELDNMLRKANRKAEEFKKTVSKYVKEQKEMLNDRFGKAEKKATKKAPAKKTSAKKSTPKKSSKKKK
jgi:gas vesicle protein